MMSRYFYFAMIMVVMVGMFACDDDGSDVPPAENEEEVITDVILTFKEDVTGEVITAKASDPDGEGIKGLEVEDTIVLKANKEYTLEITASNDLDPDNVVNVTEDVQKESDEHQIFFSFTKDIFADPSGTGNIDGDSKVQYVDKDANGNPLGLSTSWLTAASPLKGDFTVVLKHQPDVKTSTSTSEDGDTDFKISFVLEVE